MTSRKEDEKNERTIRNLLKLPDNRRCMNCNSLGPQYVCTNFWTFICTNCSGLHREFTHRVKSISMAKFSSQEVSALQGGGNASAKEIYLKEWDPQRHSRPDGSNVDRLRDFIKHVYVERRFSGEKSIDKPPRVKMGETEDSNDHRRNDSSHSGSRSPPYEDSNDRRLSDRLSSGGRSPAYEQDNRQYDKKSPARTEVVSDWRRGDRFGNGKKPEDNRVSDGSSKFGSRSPDSQRDSDVSSPPVVRPVREILGENVSPLRVLEPPKSNSLRSTMDGSNRTQRTASSSSLASSNGNPTETKFESSLIDFDAVPEPPAVQPQQSATSVPVAQVATPSSDNWANFDSFAEIKVSQPPANTNSLEYMLSQLSVPSSQPNSFTETPGSGNIFPTANTASSFPSTQPVASFGLPFGNVAPLAAANNLAGLSSGTPAAAPRPFSAMPEPGGNSFGSTVTGGQWPQPQSRPMFPAAMGGQQLPQQFSSPGMGHTNNQAWNPLSASNSQGVPNVAAQSPQNIIRPNLETNLGVVTQKSGRSELPEDLFAMNYSSMPAQGPVWNTSPPYGMGFNMPYNMPMPTPTFPQAPKSTNPFDVSSDNPPAPTFPSMAPLQSALPNLGATTGLVRSSSLGAPSAHPSAMYPNVPASYASGMPSDTNMMAQYPGILPARPHGQASFGMDAGGFGHLGSNQQIGGLQSVTSAPNNFSSVGGNPFG